MLLPHLHLACRFSNDGRRISGGAPGGAVHGHSNEALARIELDDGFMVPVSQVSLGGYISEVS